jgi:DNA primase
VDIQTVDGRAQLAELARPLLERIPEGVYRELLADEVAKLVRIDSSRLQSLGARENSRPGVHAANRARPVFSERAPAAISTGRGSVVRQAIRVLVHYPGAACEVPPPDGLEHVDRPGIPLLIELLNDLQGNPCVNTAALLERWRGRPDFEPLAKLAGSEYPVDAAGAARELAGALQQLFPEASGQRLDELVRKQSREGLTPAERLELQGFLTRTTPPASPSSAS